MSITPDDITRILAAERAAWQHSRTGGTTRHQSEIAYMVIGEFEKALTALLAEPAGPQETAWTVIGAWIGDRPVPVGVIKGVHDVNGGDTREFPEGCWAVSVSAPDAEYAEGEAVDEMRASEGLDDEDSEDEDEDPFAAPDTLREQRERS